MRLKERILPYKPDFPGLLEDYVGQIRLAIKQKKHHDHRRYLFMNFLRDAFSVDPKEVTIEEKIKLASVRGNIGALYKFI